jgi:uncharacterized protein YoxC
MIFEICAVLSTIAFVVLCVFLVQTLFRTQHTLKEIDVTLTKVNHKIDPLSSEAIKLIQNSNKLTHQLNEQITHINPLTESLSDIGEIVHNVTSSIQQEKKINFTGEKNKRIGDILDIASLGISLLQKVNKRR